MTEKRLIPVAGKQMVKVFSKIGYQIERQRGSHIVMSKDDDILVIPDHNPVARGTERETDQRCRFDCRGVQPAAEEIVVAVVVPHGFIPKTG